MPALEDAVAALTNYRHRVTGRQAHGMIQMAVPRVLGVLISEGATEEEADALLNEAVVALGGDWRTEHITWARGTKTKVDRQAWIPLSALRYD